MPVNGSKKDIYESIKMLSPDESFMCYTTKKRATWYVKRGLADWVSDCEFKINFEPKGNGKNHISFYNEVLKNRCVVCGKDEMRELNKHHVVPRVFRSRFPDKYKNFNHHDIVPICIDCHEAYELVANEYKKELLEEKGIPIFSKKEKLINENRKIISARKLLENIQDGKLNGHKIPEDRLKMIQETSKRSLAEVSMKKEVDWADQLVGTIKNSDELFKFVKMWRQHFIDTMHPKYMPERWSINHPLEEDVTGEGFVVD